MARAGFWAIESHTIRFGRDGRWYSDDEPIVNPRISLLFSQHVSRDEAGQWWIVMGDERAKIVVDDTPFVVQRVDGNPREGFSITLNDGSSEPLPAQSLALTNDVLYSSVKEGRYRARFLRAAQADLLRHVHEEKGEYRLPLPGGDSIRLSDSEAPQKPCT